MQGTEFGTEWEAAEKYCDSLHPKQTCRQEGMGAQLGGGAGGGGGISLGPVSVGSSAKTSCSYSPVSVTS